MNEGGVTGNDSPTPGNLFDEFEQAFQNCLAPLTKEDPLNGINFEELLTNAESNSQRFLDLAHRMDAAFLQKRFLLSVQKPELLIMEENHEMRVEMGRKDELIKKQTEKLGEWQTTLVNLINRVGAVPPAASARNMNTGPPIGQHTPSHPPVGGGTPGSASPAGLSPIGTPHSTSQMNIGSQISHGGSVPAHTLNSSLPMNSVPHQNIINQHASSGSSTMSTGQANFQSMNNQTQPMHNVPMGMGMQPQPSGMPPNMSGPGSGGMFNSGMGPGPQQGGMGPGPQQGGMGPGPQQGGMGPGHQQATMGGPNQGGMQGGGPGQMMGPSQGGLQGPLAFLEKTTTNIGMPDNRR